MNPPSPNRCPSSAWCGGFLLKQAGLIRPGDGQVMARLIVNTTLRRLSFCRLLAQRNASKIGDPALCGYWYLWDCARQRAGGEPS